MFFLYLCTYRKLTFCTYVQILDVSYIQKVWRIGRKFDKDGETSIDIYGCFLGHPKLIKFLASARACFSRRSGRRADNEFVNRNAIPEKKVDNGSLKRYMQTSSYRQFFWQKKLFRKSVNKFSTLFFSRKS